MVRQITRRGPTKRGGGKKHKAKPRTPKVDIHKKDKQNPDAVEQLKHISRLQKEADEKIKLADEAKKAARNAQGVANSAIKAVSEAIHEASKPNLYSPKTVANVKESNSVGSFGPTENDEAWRDEPITALNLSAKITNALREQHITTLGEYSDYLKPQPNGFEPRLQDIKGIGNAAVTTIEDAFEKFWGDWNVKHLERKKEAEKVVSDVAESTKLPAAEAKPSSNGDGEHDEIESEEGDE